MFISNLCIIIPKKDLAYPTTITPKFTQKH